MVPANRQAKYAHQRHADEMAALLRAVLASPGATEPGDREAAYRGDSLPPPLGDFVVKLRNESHRITDADIQALLAAGCSQDTIFEVTVAAAPRAAAQRLKAGLRAMHQED